MRIASLPSLHPATPSPLQHALLLRRITEALVSTRDPGQAAARLCGLVVPALADWAVVTLVDDDRRAGARQGLRHATACHREPKRQDLAESYARTWLDALTDDAVLVRSIETGRPIVITDDATRAAQHVLRPGPARDLIGALAPEHIAVLPLLGREGAVGLLSLYNGAARGPFGAADVAAAGDVAERAGLVLDNARLYRQQRSLAEALQRSLLTEPPKIRGLQIAVRYTPAAQAAHIGGDWYDAFRQGSSATFVIGDVSGHDNNAAAAMGQVRTLLRGVAVATQAGPAELLSTVDAVMADLQVATLATTIIARLTPPVGGAGTWGLRWSNAGHPPPLLAHADGRVTVLRTRPELLLGVAPGTLRTETGLEVEPGATLLLYTDGLIERPRRVLDDGLKLLRRAVADLIGSSTALPIAEPPLEELCDALLDRMLQERPRDDVALLAVRLQP